MARLPVAVTLMSMIALPGSIYYGCWPDTRSPMALGCTGHLRMTIALRPTVGKILKSKLITIVSNMDCNNYVHAYKRSCVGMYF